MGRQRASATKTSAAFSGAASPSRTATASSLHPMRRLQGAIGNRAVNRMVSQESEHDSYVPEAARAQVLESVVDYALGSPGERLDARTRDVMGQRFERDFADVRIHADARAAQSARALSARAYTIGNDVVFGAGRYAPGSREGQRTLAHELAHVVQQDGVITDGPLSVSEPSDPLEHEAERLADQLTSDAPVGAPRDAAHGAGGASLAAHGHADGAAVQRDQEEADSLVEHLSDLHTVGELGGMGAVLGPTGLLLGGYEIGENLGRGHVGLEQTAGATKGGLEVASGALGTAELLGLAETGPAGLVVGSGLAGYRIGQEIENQTHIGSRAGDAAYDVLGPDPGLWLADHLPSWLQ